MENPGTGLDSGALVVDGREGCFIAQRGGAAHAEAVTEGAGVILRE